MVDESRRNILAILGLAAVGTPAFAAEQFDTFEQKTPPRVPGLMLRSALAQSQMAAALDAAAAAIRRGELTATQIDINSVVTFNEWMQHKVTFTFELSRPGAPVA